MPHFTDKRFEALTHPIRYPVILKYFGQLSSLMAVLSSIPLVVSLLSSEYLIGLRYTGIIILLLVLGLLSRNIKTPANVQTNEAMTVAVMVFVVSPFLMTYPLMGSGIAFQDALFESVSAVTTTGLSTLPTVEDKPVTFLFSRSWMQWYGGLGIVVLSLALLTGPGFVAKRLAATQFEKEELSEGARMHAKKVLIVYIILTLLGILLLFVVGVDWFSAIIHTFAAVSTGGFSSHDVSIAGLGNRKAEVLTLFISLAGALSFTLYYKTNIKRALDFFRDVEVQGIFLALLLITSVLVLTMHFFSSLSWHKSLFHATLMGISSQTTAGFASLKISGLDNATKMAMILSMAIGGNMGSTAGGMKILRVIVLLRIIHLLIIRTQAPKQAVIEARVQGSRLHGEEIEGILVLIVLYILVIIMSWIPFIAAGYEPLDALFEVVSATGTVGLSVGITSNDLSTFLKMVLCLDMIMGRVEIVGFLVFLFPGNWFQLRRTLA